MRYTAALLILLGTGSIARAQEASVAGAQMRTNDRLLGDLGGIAAGATWAWSPVFAWRVTYNHLGRDQARMGVACAGLLPPDPALCPVETIDDDVTAKGVALGLVTTVARRGSLALSVIPSAAFFGVRSTSEGRQTGNRLSAAESMIGFALVPSSPPFRTRHGRSPYMWVRMPGSWAAWERIRSTATHRSRTCPRWLASSSGSLSKDGVRRPGRRSVASCYHAQADRRIAASRGCSRSPSASAVSFSRAVSEPSGHGDPSVHRARNARCLAVASGISSIRTTGRS